MRQFFEPAPAPFWAREILRTIRRAVTDVWPVPLRLKDYAAAELPAASQHKQGLVYDSTTGEVKWSDGSAWAAFSTSGHSHSAADLMLSASDRLVGRDAAGAGAAEELIVGGGLEFTGAGGLQRSALSGDVIAAAGSGVVTIADDAVANAKLADMAQARLKGRAASAGTGDPIDLTPAEAKTLLAIVAADISDLAEAVRDRVGATLAAGAGIAIAVDDPGDTVTLASTITQYGDEMARDALAAALTAGAGISITPNDGADTITIASTITQYGDEMARDALGSALTAGAGIAITPNDGADTINVACTITQYSDELAQDAVGAILADSATIDFSYDDAGGQITAAVRDNSVTYAKLQNVSATDRLLGRSSSGAGDVEEIACTAAGRSMVAAADADAQRTLLRSGCMVRKSVSETGINASAGGYFLSWDVETYDDGGYHDNVANNSRLTTLAGQTRVRVGCMILFANVTAGSQMSVVVYKNGGAAYDGRPAAHQTSPSAILQPVMTVASGPIPVSGGTDYFQVAIYCSDTSIDVATGSSFWIEAC